MPNNPINPCGVALQPHIVCMNYLNRVAQKPILWADLNGQVHVTKEGLHFLYDTIFYNRKEPGIFEPYVCRRAPKCAWQEKYE